MRAEDETDTILDTAEGQAMTHLLNSKEWAGQNVLSRAGLIKRRLARRSRRRWHAGPATLCSFWGRESCQKNDLPGV